MNTRERFTNLMSGKPVDRLPMFEWASWWDLTIDRWKSEGLPKNLTDERDIRKYLGIEDTCQDWINFCTADFPSPAHGAPSMLNFDDYNRLKKYMFPKETLVNTEKCERFAKLQQAGNSVMWWTFEGFFWSPRKLLGIENHLCAFYDNTELMKALNEDLLEYYLRVIDKAGKYYTPEFMTFAEDMSYNHGPMISKELYDEFMLPYYKRIIPELKKRGIKVFVDTDGLVHDLIPWFLEAGFDGFLPLERMAGVDVNLIRKRHPGLMMIGAFDKTVMHLGEGAIRKEFERLMPAMKSGKYIPCTDHQTPPAVSLSDYKLYVKLLEEYCRAAAK